MYDDPIFTKSCTQSSLYRKVKMDVLPIELATGFQGNAIMFFLISLIVPSRFCS